MCMCALLCCREDGGAILQLVKRVLLASSMWSIHLLFGGHSAMDLLNHKS